MSSCNPLMSNCNHFQYYYVYIHTIHTMSIDMVIENSELMLRPINWVCPRHIFLGVPNTSESTQACPILLWGAPSGIGGIY